MTPAMVRVLLIEDDEDDVFLIKDMLAEVSPKMQVMLACAGRLETGLNLLARGDIDAILLDLNLPDSRGLDTLKRLSPRESKIPIVVLTGLDDEQTAIEAVHLGAQDYLIKGEISGQVLARVLRYAIERKQVEKKLRDSEKQFRQVVEHIHDALITDDIAGRITFANDQFLTLFGFQSDQLPHLKLEDYIAPEWREILRERHDRRLRGETVPASFEYEGLRQDGRRLWLEVDVALLKDDAGYLIGTQSAIRDITERKQAEERVALQIRRLASLRAIDQAIASHTDIGVVLDEILNHVISQLGVDAVTILLYNPAARTLEYAVERGFHTDALNNSHLFLEEGYAAQVMLKRQTIRVHDLQSPEADIHRSLLFLPEQFVSYFGVPLIAKGEIQGVLEVFHRSRLEPDGEWLNFLETLGGQTAIAIDNAALFKGLQQTNMELMLAYDATIEGWSHALDLRDKETQDHTRRVTDLTVRMARKMGIPEKEIIHIRRGALLHDIGKMGVPDSILLKPDKLTEDEWVIMKKHTQFAFDMLYPIPYLRPALDIPYCHHEKWDGTGYPRGLKGEEIPLAARLFSVVDVWDALRSDRPYSQSWSEEKTFAYIRSEVGTRFDPMAVDVFFQVLK
ncbi:MAG: PAS domain S-box protein [Kouleothrix sp.]|jgi:PAS domain S-box-containing protein/putative nucleotidyltransferase with HDIG domain|nr:PAS domain S-box protein [Kouleothrix sp.]